MSRHADPARAQSAGWRRPTRSPSPGRMSSASAAVSTASRYDANQSMRERAAAMWLEQLRQSHDRRRNVAQRHSEIAEYQRSSTLQKINDKDAQLHQSQRANAEFRERRTEAFQERQQYLAAAKQHAEAVQETRQQQIEQHSAARAAQGDQLRTEAVTRRQVQAYERNTQRHATARQNHEMIDRCREELKQRVLDADAYAAQRVADRRRADDEQRRRRRAEAEVARRATHDRAGRLDAQRRAGIESKIGHDADRAAQALWSREQSRHDRAVNKRERAAAAAEQVRRAREARGAREQEWEQHFEETVAIGRETAEHNKLFKLNNRIMHQLMMESRPRPSPRGSARRSLQSPQRGGW